MVTTRKEATSVTAVPGSTQRANMQMLPSTSNMDAESAPSTLGDEDDHALQMHDDKIAYSVVVPVYNSSRSLVELFERLQNVFTKELNKAQFELVLVDDASPDPQTWKTIQELSKTDPRVHPFQMLRNAGQHAATLCGIRHARGRIIITMDDDLQHPPEEIPKLLRAYGNGNEWDAVFGVAESRQSAHAYSRNLGSWLFNQLMSRTVDRPEGLQFSSFRLMNRALCDAVGTYQGYFVTLNSLICMKSRRIVNANINLAPRPYGASSYTLSKLAALALNHLFNFSSTPLKAMSAIGFSLSFLALLYAVLVFYWRVTGAIQQAGFATITILISLYSGVILLALGVLGQYLVRILRTTTFGAQYHLRQSPSDVPVSDKGDSSS